MTDPGSGAVSPADGGAVMFARVSPECLRDWLHDGREIALFDVREHGQYGASHLFHGVSLPYSRLELDVSRLAPNPAVRVVLYDDDGHDVAPRAAQRLHELGYGQVAILAGGRLAWQAAGFELFAGVNVPSKTFGELVEALCRTPRLSARALKARQARGEPLLILDGRPFEEFRKMSIPGARCCPNGELAYRLGDLVADRRTPIVINCAGRTRSIIGAQTLIHLGVENPVYALENGTQGWFLEDFALEHGAGQRYAETVSSASARLLAPAARRLAERAGVRWVEAPQVAEWAREGGRSLFLCDVRTPEEFAAGSLSGAQHTPGGQLVQATDQYLGVRGARLVLFDNDDVRAATAASWLRQLGHEAYVLRGGLASGLGLPVAAPLAAPLDTFDSVRLAGVVQHVRLVDLRPSSAYRRLRLARSEWSIRPRLTEQVAGERRPLVLLAEHAGIARLALDELPDQQRRQARVLVEGPEAWRRAGLALEEGGDVLENAACIDFLFFTHGRHEGDKVASRQYLAWELGLLDQLDPRDREGYRPLGGTPCV